jgi:hypothetical protein
MGWLGGWCDHAGASAREHKFIEMGGPVLKVIAEPTKVVERIMEPKCNLQWSLMVAGKCRLQVAKEATCTRNCQGHGS